MSIAHAGDGGEEEEEEEAYQPTGSPAYSPARLPATPPAGHLLLAAADAGEAICMTDVAYPSYFGAGK